MPSGLSISNEDDSKVTSGKQETGHEEVIQEDSDQKMKDNEKALRLSRAGSLIPASLPKYQRRNKSVGLSPPRSSLISSVKMSSSQSCFGEQVGIKYSIKEDAAESDSSSQDDEEQETDRIEDLCEDDHQGADAKDNIKEEGDDENIKDSTGYETDENDVIVERYVRSQNDDKELNGKEGLRLSHHLPQYQRRNANRKSNVTSMGSSSTPSLLGVSENDYQRLDKSINSLPMTYGFKGEASTGSLSTSIKSHVSADGVEEDLDALDESYDPYGSEAFAVVPGAYRVRGADWNGRESQEFTVEECNGNASQEVLDDMNSEQAPNAEHDIEGLQQVSSPRRVDQGGESNDGKFRRNKRKRKLWIIAAIILIIASAIGLGVGLNGKSGDNAERKPESERQDSEEVDDCEYAGVKNFSIAWKSCLCNERLVDIPENYKAQYDQLKNSIILEGSLSSFDYNMSSCEVPNIALHWLAEDIVKRENARNDSLLDRYALATCFLSWTNKRLLQWKDRQGWMTGKSVCEWLGIECNRDGDVTKIALAGNKLAGNMPTEISLLTKLFSLQLSNNQIEGVIPTEIGHLTSLRYLVLSQNRFVGSIPSEIGYMSNLEDFFVDSNKNVYGEKNIIGSIPSEIGRLTSLLNMNFDGNSITGSIPTEIGFLSSLEMIKLNDNEIAGSIPSTLMSCVSLAELSFIRNQITGTIPSEIGLLSNAVSVKADSNKIEGSIPSTIGNLHNVQTLSLQFNKLIGPIPSFIANCASLQYFYLQENNISGSIPTEIGSMQALRHVVLERNRFEGSLPSHLGNCQNLRILDISFNRKIVGTAPPELGNLSNLEQFDFSQTSMTGTIPEEICSLREINLKNLFGSRPSFGQPAPECGCCDFD